MDKKHYVNLALILITLIIMLFISGWGLEATKNSEGNYFLLNRSFYWLHIVIGFLWLAMIFVFIVEHLQKYRNHINLKEKQFYSGGMLLIILALCLISGIIAFLFIEEDGHIYREVHLYSAWASLFMAIIHIKIRNLAQIKNKPV